jgi:hypothetical protein
MNMAGTAREQVYRTFLAESGQQAPALGDANAILRDVVAQLREVASSETTPAVTKGVPSTVSQDSSTTDQAFLTASSQQASAIGDANTMLASVIGELAGVRSSIATQAPATRTPATTTSQDSGVSVGSIASTVLKSGFGLAPLISGLVGLFSGGGADTPAPLVKYALPTAIDFQAAQSNGQVTALDYDQTGMARTYAERAGGGARSNGNGAGQQITVNVQAMDARSFLDRSNDIALAVRDAMLNMNAINDVVNEL